jgi:hypothetical protein
MKIIFTLALFATSFNTMSQTKTTVVTYKNVACNDAACDCFACSWEFITEDGKELFINEFNLDTDLNLDLFNVHEEEGGWVETTPNPIYIDKKFEISYTITSCNCEDIQMDDYKILTAIKKVN